MYLSINNSGKIKFYIDTNMTANKIFADRYQCLPVGEGGMASVYLPMDIKLNREVAIKVMHDHMRKNLN